MQHRGRCYRRGITEHSVRWYTFPFQNVVSLHIPEFAKHNPDGSVFETQKERMRNWRCKGPQRLHAPITLGTIRPLNVLLLGLRMRPV